MAINPWEALGYAVRAAHIVGSTKGAVVRLDDTLDGADPPDRGVYGLHCIRAASQDHARNTYTISTAGAGVTAQVYWLPWGHNPSVATSILNGSGADFFLTSGMSGCHFVGCDGMVMHTAAGYKAGSGGHPVDHALGELDEWGEDMGKDTSRRFILSPGSASRHASANALYGGGGGPPRAVVLGWKKPGATPQWFFAYQDLTLATAKYAMWNPLRPA